VILPHLRCPAPVDRTGGTSDVYELAWNLRWRCRTRLEQIMGVTRMGIPFRRSSNTTEGGPETIRRPFPLRAADKKNILNPCLANSS
jgi:hypothetical protein